LDNQKLKHNQQSNISEKGKAGAIRRRKATGPTKYQRGRIAGLPKRKTHPSIGLRAIENSSAFFGKEEGAFLCSTNQQKGSAVKEN
jgi:hypothetical protein